MRITICVLCCVVAGCGSVTSPTSPTPEERLLTALETLDWEGRSVIYHNTKIEKHIRHMAEYKVTHGEAEDYDLLRDLLKDMELTHKKAVTRHEHTMDRRDAAYADLGYE